MRELGVPNHLQARLEEKKKDRSGVIIAGLLILLLSIIPSILVSPWFLAAGGIIFLIILAGTMADAEKRILENGIKGEDTLRGRLKEILSDEYIGIFNIPLKEGGDIDCFLIGPTGAYLFEVKFHKGYILYCDRKWTQEKIGKKGKVYEGTHLKNPGLQVMRGINEVKKLLRSKGINLWIEGVVVFANPETMVFSENTPELKVISISELETIFQGGSTKISKEDIELIASLVYKKFTKKKE